MYRYCRDEDDNTIRYCAPIIIMDMQYYRPNYICPVSYVTPLTSNQSYLRSRINTMQARGHTLGELRHGLGMAFNITRIPVRGRRGL